MNGQTLIAQLNSKLSLLSFFVLSASGTALAQVPVDQDGNPVGTYSEASGVSDTSATPASQVLSAVETLVGPIALYPDDLLAIVLPASSYPLEIVQAARFIERLKSDSSLKPDDDWDDSIIALLNYPEVIQMMDGDIDWMWRLGEAVISQQSEVINAVEAFRDRAYAAGNLKTDEYQTVSNDEGIIEITPVDEEIIYVPYYEPAEMVVYQPRPVYNYYPSAYPSYYYPYPIGYQFRYGQFWGVTTAFSIGWGNNYLNVYHPSYLGHPYYGRSYYGNFYRHSSIGLYNSWYGGYGHSSQQYRYSNGDHWRPRSHAGSRQHEPSVRNIHYPPGSDQRRREHSAGRSQLDNRHNGRLNLNLRERNDSGSHRSSPNNSSRTGYASGRDHNRQSTSSDRRNRSNSGEQHNQARALDADNRSRVSPNRTASTRNHSNTDARAEIRFRDRSNDRGASGSRTTSPRTTTRPTADRQNSHRSTSDSNRTVARPSQHQGRVATAPRPNDRAGYSSGSNRQSSHGQQRVAPSPRATAPRVQRPSSRATPRVQHQAPERTVAPTSGHKQQRAPSGNHESRSSNRRSSGSNRNRSSGSNHNNRSGSRRNH